MGTKGSVVYADCGWNTNNNNDKQLTQPASTGFGLPNISRSQTMNASTKYGGLSYQMGGGGRGGISDSAHGGMTGKSLNRYYSIHFTTSKQLNLYKFYQSIIAFNFTLLSKQKSTISPLLEYNAHIYR